MAAVLARGATTGITDVLRREVGKDSEPVFDQIITALKVLKEFSTTPSEEGRASLAAKKEGAIALFTKPSSQQKKLIRELKTTGPLTIEREIAIWTELRQARAGLFQVLIEGGAPYIQEGIAAGKSEAKALEGRIHKLSPEPIRNMVRALELIKNQRASFTDEEKRTIYMAKRAFSTFAEDVNLEGTSAYKALSEEQRSDITLIHEALSQTSLWASFGTRSGKIVAPDYDPTSESQAEFVLTVLPLLERLNNVRSALGGTIENANHALEASSQPLIDRLDEAGKTAGKALDDVIQKQTSRFEGLSLADVIAKVAIAILFLPITLPIAIVNNLFFSSVDTKSEPEPRAELTFENLQRLQHESKDSVLTTPYEGVDSVYSSDFSTEQSSLESQTA